MIQRDYNDTNFITSLRAIAILLVFLIHSGGAGLLEFGKIGNFIVNCGKYGVQIFFVISGFTIFSQFYSEKYTLKKFIFVRLSRISISYYPILFGLFVYINLGGTQFNGWADKFNNGGIDLANLLAHIAYLSPYYIKFQNTIIGVEWTLGIEVFFYLLFGWLIAFKFIKLNGKSFCLFGILFFILSLGLKILAKYFHWDPLFFSWLPFVYGYMFFLGGLAYYFRKLIHDSNGKLRADRSLISDRVLIAIILFFAVLAVSSDFFKIPDFLIELCFVIWTFLIIVFFDNKGKLSRALNNKGLLFIGSISYSFYLIHYMITSTFFKFHIAIIDFIVELVVTILVSFIWYYIFEKLIYTRVKKEIKKIKEDKGLRPQSSKLNEN
jgi:peptidoglycan/LPS O-acetylase OafA/YrhL